MSRNRIIPRINIKDFDTDERSDHRIETPLTYRVAADTKLERQRTLKESFDASVRLEQSSRNSLKASIDRVNEAAKERKKKREEEEKARKKAEEIVKQLDRQREEERRQYERNPKSDINYSKADEDNAAMASLYNMSTKYSGASASTALIGLISRNWFDIKDRVGRFVHNSIFFNGENLQSRIGEKEMQKLYAQAHEQMLAYQDTLDDLVKQRNSISPIQNKNDYDLLTSQIDNIQAIMQNSQLKELDDMYKRTYGYDNGGLINKAKSYYKALVVDPLTYDLYKGYVADKRKLQQIAQYDNVIANQASENGIDIVDPKNRYNFERKQLDEYVKNTDSEIEELRNEFIENRKHLAESDNYWKVRESFKRGEQIYQNASLWNPNYWGYVLPGIAGSSASSPSQLVSTGINVAGMAAAAGAAIAGQPELSPWILNTANILSMPSRFRAGFDENYGETGMKRIENMKNLLKRESTGLGEDGYNEVMTDLKAQSYDYWNKALKEKGWSQLDIDNYMTEYLFKEDGDDNVLRELFAGLIKNNNPKVVNSMIYSTQGLAAQRDADNMRTVASEVAQSAFMFVPGGNVSKMTAERLDAGINKIVNQTEKMILKSRSGKVVTESAENASTNLKKAYLSKYVNKLGDASNAVQNYGTGATLGEVFGFGFGGQAIGVGAQYTAEKLGKAAIANISPKTRAAFDALEYAVASKYQRIYDKLMPTSEWGKLAVKYGLKTVGATLASSMSESAEEATQYLNEKEDFASSYGFDGMNLGQMVANDLRQGGRVFNSYLSLLGLSESELKDDAEYWANVKGGFALGGGHTMFQRGLGSITEASREYDVNSVLMYSSAMNREIDKIDRASNAEFARQAFAGRESQVINYIETQQKQDSRRDNPNFSQEDYEEKLSDAKSVMALTKNKLIRAALAKSGIDYGTEEYANAVADIYALLKRANQNMEQRNKGVGDVAAFYASKEFNDALDEETNRQVALSNINNIKDEDERKQAISNSRDIIKGVNVLMNRLRALIQLKAQSNSIEKFYNMLNDKFGLNPIRSDARAMVNNIDEQIKSVIDNIKEFDDTFDPKSDEEILSYLELTFTPIAGVNTEEIESIERANALLNADAAVLNSYIEQVGTKDYSRRVNAIIEASKRNAKYDWMVNDIYEGDAVTKLMDIIAEEKRNAQKQEQKEDSSKNKEEEVPFESQQQKADKIVEKNHKKYSSRLAKAKERYQRRKLRINKFNRNTLNSQIPFQNLVTRAANDLLYAAESGVYKFQLFVDDFKEVAGESSLTEALPLLKHAYINRRARYIMNESSFADNMSSGEDVAAFGAQAERKAPKPEPVKQPLHKKMQDRISSNSLKIIPIISTHYHQFVNDEDGIHVYRNEQSIEHSRFNKNNARLQETIKKLNDANTSDEEFNKTLSILSEHIPGFPVNEYVKYRNVDGAIEAAAVNIISGATSQSLENAIKVQNAVSAIMLGRKEELDPMQFPKGFDLFVEDIEKVRDGLLGLGLTILDTLSYLYTTLPDGRRISEQADIVAADDKNRIYLIDVTTSSRPVISRLDNDGYYGTIRQRVLSTLKQTEQIINSLFEMPVKGMYMLPIVYNEYTEDGIRVDKNNGNSLYKFKINESSYETLDLDVLKRQAKNAIDQINNEITILNELAKEVNKFDLALYAEKETLQEYDNKEDYVTYLNSLSAKLQSIQSAQENLKNKLQQHINTYEDAVISINNDTQFNISEDFNATVLYLEACCDELDLQLQDTPIIIPTTAAEKENIKRLYLTLFDAQQALNSVLLYPTTDNIDITAEEELIAKAMEIVVQNPNVFGQDAPVIKNWWVNNMLIASKNTNTSEGVRSIYELFAGYKKTIESWVDTLSQHVISQLDGNTELQNWYGTILNNHFAKLLENASKFSTTLELPGRQILEGIINKGVNLIQEFNLTWNFFPDEQVTDFVDDIDRINKMPIKWYDLYSVSDKHTPSISAMRINLNYYHMSRLPQFEQNVRVRLYVADREMKVVNTSNSLYNGLSYTIRPGDVVAYVTDGKNFADIPIMSEPWEGATVLDLERINRLNNANLKLDAKVRAMALYIKTHPEYDIYVDVTFNKGSILYNPIGELNFVTDFLFSDNLNSHDLYTITLSSKDDIGIGRFVVDKTINTTFYDVRAGENLDFHIGNFDDQYIKQHLNITSGLIVYFYKTSDGQKIGVPIQAKNIGLEDATKLANLLKLFSQGITIYDGYDVEELLKQRLYMYNLTRYLTQYNNISNMVSVESNGNIKIGADTYNVYQNMPDLIQRLSRMDNSTPAQLLSKKINDTSSTVATRIISQIRSGKNKVELPNGLIITADDITHNNNDGSIGSTWLGYFLRNGIYATRASGVDYKQINIGNPVLYKRGTEPVPVETKPIEPIVQDDILTTDIDDIIFGGGLRMTVNTSELQTNRTPEQKEKFKNFVNDYVKRVLGDTNIEFTDAVENSIIDIPKNEAVVGYCARQIIKFSTCAPYSIAFHETFHKIMELILPEDTRNKFYSAYRKRNGENLSERDVAEGLADIFTDLASRVYSEKGMPWYKSIFKWFKALRELKNTVNKLGFERTFALITLYSRMNRGKYANKETDDAKAKRFADKFNDQLYYTVQNKNTKQQAEFKYIADSGQLQDMVKSLGYYILEAFNISDVDPDLSKLKFNNRTPSRLLAQGENGLPIIDTLVGKDLPEDKLTLSHLAFREILESVNKDGVFIYPKFDAISDKVADYISTIVGDPRIRSKVEEVSDEQEENSDTTISTYTKWDSASYEFSKLESVTKQVKLFFATIPYTTFDKDGNVVIDRTKNQFGTPTYMPIDEVYNVIVNEMHTVNTMADFFKALQKRAKTSSTHRMLLNKFYTIIRNAYNRDENGNLVIDYNAEAVGIQIVNAIRSHKHNFIVALSTNYGNEGKHIRITQSSLDRDAAMFTDQWTQFLVSGQIGPFARTRDNNGNIRFKDNKIYANGTDIFSITSKFITLTILALSKSGQSTIDGIVYNTDIPTDVEKIKDQLLLNFRKIGIVFSKDALDHMLLSDPNIRDTGKNGMLSWLTSSGAQSVNNFIQTLDNFVYSNGLINQQAVTEGYSKIGFVRNLANWQSAYNRVHTQQMALALNNKRLYSVSQNNTISHINNILNSQDVTNDYIRTLLGFGYNVRRINGIAEGSIIAKNILLQDGSIIQAHTYIGFRTDNTGDYGSEYTQEATVEDYMAKLTMLQNGYMLFPTLADKSTWMILSGVKIPGMIYLEQQTSKGHIPQVTLQNAPSIKFLFKNPYIIPNATVLSLMCEYARTERYAILQCMEQLGYDEIPGYTKEGLQIIPDNAKIKNYHTNNKKVEPNGTRFLGLTKIVVRENGEIKEYNLNDPRFSSVDCLKLANKKFFDKSEEEQNEIMALTLAKHTEHEIEEAIRLGIVYRDDVKSEWVDDLGNSHTIDINKSEKSLYNLKSDHLNRSQIDAIANHFMNILGWQLIDIKTGNVNKRNEKQFKRLVCESLAIAAILNDATIRHIISTEEALRCYIGHPGQFKVSYGSTSIKDSAFDIQKRIGGLISTGDDNMPNLPGLSDKYVCAELKDYEVASKSDISSNLKEMFINGQVREMYGILTGDWNKAYSTETYKELIDSADTKLKDALNKAIEDGKTYAQAYTGGINVADGAAYITADMCENMLRRRGAYSEDVKKAFLILTDDNTKYSWMDRKDAYNTVYEAVNIVPTKYTAYGFREHTVNGDKVSNMAVAYYNKFALFPLFPSLATGNMSGLYNQMLNEGVDMLLMDSAVKLGSLAAISWDGETTSSIFNKYVQDFGFLRRLLNTDPEEGDRMNAGTQMIKIGLQNLRLDRVNYTDSRTGELLSGKLIRDRMMSAINNLAKLGVLELQNMFFKEGSTEIDPTKLSTYLKDLLSVRNANKAIIDAIQTEVDPETGATKLVAPISATPDATWIESILISTVNKKIIDIQTPGSSFVQRSVFAIEGHSIEGGTEINGGANLQMINNDGSMDAMISMDYFDQVLFTGKLRNMSFNEKRQWLIDHNIIGQNAKANTIGYRIPTQAQSSIHALRFVDVLPGTKTTIILPEEFTKITGSDRHQCSNFKKFL